MKISNTEVFGFRSALRAMRNPFASWAKSDSRFYGDSRGENIAFAIERPEIGPNDLKLALKLIKAGSEHRKFLRQIIIWADLTLPRYMWQEFDTYKVATVRNSCSTMHKLGHRSLVLSDFQDEAVPEETLTRLNTLGETYRDSKKQGFGTVRTMKQILPESFLQKSTYTMSYETALNMLLQRGSHRLPEWSGPSGVCEWLRKLPYLAVFEHEVRSK